jgi:small-conductance mechanosensitive channel
MMMKALEQVYYDNTVLAYLVAAGLFLFLIALLKVFRVLVLRYLKKWSEKTKTRLDDFLIQAVEKAVLPLLYFAVFYLSVSTLNLPVKIQKLLHAASVVVITFFVLRLATHAIRHFIETRIGNQENSEAKLKQVTGIMFIINAVIWILGIIFLLDNFGYDVTAFITGIGIGGIAIALAAQNILGDLFNYFVIFFDRPFEVGDFIIVDNKMGTVEAIGIKTSRIRSLTGEQLVFANSDLTNSRIHNYKRMEKRRIVFSIGVTYQTSPENLRMIPDIIKNIITAREDVEFDRAHFNKYGDYSLNIEVVYYVLSADYGKYLDIQQAINLQIFDEFQQRAIDFAYPTQTLLFDKSEPGLSSKSAKSSRSSKSDKSDKSSRSSKSAKSDKSSRSSRSSKSN